MLDIRTLYLLLTLSSFVAGFSVLWMQLPDSGRRRSAVLWAIANFMVASGLLLIGMRDIIPLWPSAVLGNTLMMSGFLLFYISFTGLSQKAPSLRFFLLASLSYFVAYHFLVTRDVSVAHRIGIVSLVLMTLSAFMIRSAQRAADIYTRMPARLMQVFYGIVFITGAARGIHSTLFESGARQLFEPTLVQVISFLGYYFGLIGAGVAYLMMQGALTYRDLAIIANKDMLTGVRNRRNFLEMAERDLALAQRMWRPLTVLMLDLDNFKHINDEFGHLAGDEVLRRFGAILHKAVRQADLVGRYGGEEFCIVLTDTAPEAAQHTAERIRRDFETEEIMVNGRRIPASVSIGIAGMNAGDSRSIQQLLNTADIALYDAKHAGRNCIRFGKAA